MLKLASAAALAMLPVGVMLVWAPQQAAAKPDRTGVCHRDDEGGFSLVVVSERALPAHLRHGDAEPGDAVPDGEAVFDEDCAIVGVTPAEPIEPGCYASSTGYNDLLYEGPLGAAPNVALLDSFDGDCDGEPYGVPMALVIAADQTSAEESCEGFGYSEALGEPLNGPTYGYTGLPADAWLCISS